jgi:DNA-binding NarL/FixJ family response regulator
LLEISRPFIGVPTLGIIESRPIVRSGVMSLLASLGAVHIVGAVPSVKDLPHLGEPELLALGMDIPGTSPLQTLAFLSRRLPRTRVFGIQSTAVARVRVASGRLAGWISISSSSRDIARLLGVPYDAARALEPSTVALGPRIHVTRREQDVLDLIARAYSNRLVALELGIAEGTVKRHLTNLFEKFGAASRMHLVSLARDRNLVT